MKLFANICRILVGSLFIVSGLIKANDTLGFSYKLEEYFENGALAFRIRNMFGWDSFSLEFLMEHALMLAIIMCALEIILGFALLFGTRIKITTYSLLGLTVLFFFLTLHTATCDPTANYNENTTLAVGTPEYERMITRIEEGSKIEIIEENEQEATFQEKLPVQCVTDCGCFGDAMKGSLGRSLTPWESFNKDLILMILLIPVFLQRKKLKYNNLREDAIILIPAFALVGFYSWVFDWYFPLIFTAVGFGGYMALKPIVKSVYTQFIPIGFAAIISLAFIYYTYTHLPIRDYRAYAVGKNIPEQMVLPEGAQPDVYENIFFYKNKTTGKVEEFTESNYPWDDENYEFSDRQTKLIKAGDHPAITDFTMVGEDGNDYAQDYLSEPGYLFLVVAYDLNKTNLQSYKKINTFVDQCNAEGQYVIGLTASLQSDVEKLRNEQNVSLDFFSCDAITLKTIVRANPGILLLKEGTILAKWNVNQLPDYNIVKETYLK
ncbi:MAG: hypothetical protein H6586_00780 [Flavobacteriales bacterium]|nr:hypothetical protein [Flavobacteriales bacterium]